MRSIAFAADGSCLLAATQDGLTSWAWEPVKCLDSVTVPWAKVPFLYFWHAIAQSRASPTTHASDYRLFFFLFVSLIQVVATVTDAAHALNVTSRESCLAVMQLQVLYMWLLGTYVIQAAVSCHSPPTHLTDVAAHVTMWVLRAHNIVTGAARLYTSMPLNSSGAASLLDMQVQDMSINQQDGRLVACSCNNSFVGVWLVDLAKLSPITSQSSLRSSGRTVHVLLLEITSRKSGSPGNTFYVNS